MFGILINNCFVTDGVKQKVQVIVRNQNKLGRMGGEGIAVNLKWIINWGTLG
jgi:hypothetical protein